uniref:Uncharacterized protein n=2 Tax=Odontella aurita TaxID=265563 RepID=A0A7S4HQR9_9STRA|mmetsp:Transcript_13599/g.39679  ORF Transcript_13599/g.39679 Transcript_13599/m.39679 type:complete len:503 (+) Transcript_13599:409-1917(+)
MWSNNLFILIPHRDLLAPVCCLRPFLPDLRFHTRHMLLPARRRVHLRYDSRTLNNASDWRRIVVSDSPIADFLVVSTSAVLTAAGVGDAEATAMSAAAAWALRDGLGMIGGLLFSYFASRDFDSRVKEWRLFADVVNDVGLTLDMVAPYFGKGGVLYVTSLATVCKSMCGISAGATKASITHHFSVRGNMADLSAKEGTQETLVSLLGMILGVALARYLHRLETSSVCDGGAEDDSSACDESGWNAMVVSWSIFVALTILHVWANYHGVKLLRLRSLNRQRAEVALRDVVERCAEQCMYAVDACKDATKKHKNSLDVPSLLASIPPPIEVNESLWASTKHLLFPGKVRLGARLSETFRGMGNEDVRYCLDEEFRSERYILSITCRRGVGRVCVALRMGANEHAELKAFLHAMIAAQLATKMLSKGKCKNAASWQRDVIRITHEYVNELCAESDGTAASIDGPSVSLCTHISLATMSGRGWNCERLYLGFGPWRIQWEDVKQE